MAAVGDRFLASSNFYLTKPNMDKFRNIMKLLLLQCDHSWEASLCSKKLLIATTSGFIINLSKFIHLVVLRTTDLRKFYQNIDSRKAVHNSI